MRQYHPRAARTALALIVLVLAPTAVTALECVRSPPRDQRYWSWRQIDGRRCWYPGRPGMSKTKLRWANASASPLPRKQTYGSALRPLPIQREQDDVLLESVWPPMPQDSFEERFVGAR
jgi:hypothetical protein